MQAESALTTRPTTQPVTA